MNREQVMECVERGDLEEAKRLLWAEVTGDWCASMAPVMESARDRHAKANRTLAIWCYEQARALYQAGLSGATSGGEGMAMMAEGRGSHLGRKIWLLGG